jgi:hypothetical protein
MCSVRTGRPKSFTSFTRNLQKPRRPSKVSQSQRQRQLHPTRPLGDRPSGRVRSNHLRGLPFPSRGQGDLAQGSLAVAGAVELCWSLSLPLILNRIVPARLIPTPHVLPTRIQQHHLRLTVSCHSSKALAEKHTRRRESLGGIWNPFPVPTPNINLPPDSPSLRPRADNQDPAHDQVPPAITQQIYSTLRHAFARPDLPPDTLRGVVLQVNHTARTSRNTPEVVAETPPTTRMAETMSPIGIANVRITNHTTTRASSNANSI